MFDEHFACLEYHRHECNDIMYYVVTLAVRNQSVEIL